MVPFINLTKTIPAIITTNTMANATDNADVYLSESGEKHLKQDKVLCDLLAKLHSEKCGCGFYLQEVK